MNWLLSSSAWNGTLANYGRGVKRGSPGLHIPIPSSSWAWFFSLFFIRKFHIELCHSRPTTYFAAPKKNCHFHIWYTYFQIKHWNMLYNVGLHTCNVLPYFFTLSYYPVSTHSINRTVTTNYVSPKSIDKTVETLWLTKLKRIFTLFLISHNVAALLWLVMLVVGLLDIQYSTHAVCNISFFFFFFKNCYYFSDLETWPRNPRVKIKTWKLRLCLSSTVIRGAKSQYWRKISLSSVSVSELTHTPFLG